MSIKQGSNVLAGLQDISGKANIDMDNISSTGNEYIANCAMPSDRYVNLTLGSSGASYTAPADGYVVFDKASSGANQYIRMTTSDGLRVLNNSTGSGQYLAVFLPVKKNQQFYVFYTAGGTTNSFRFVYAQGAQ